MNPQYLHTAACDMMREADGFPRHELGLAKGLLAIQIQVTGKATKIDDLDDKIGAMSDAVKACVRGSQIQARIAHLNQYLFDDGGFAGEIDFRVQSNCIMDVIASKSGSPVILAAIYKLVAERLGIRVSGISLPGHMLAQVDMSDGEGDYAMVDPSGGGKIVTRDEATELMRQRFGPNLDVDQSIFDPISNLLWITRCLQNLLHTFGGIGQYQSVAAMLELEMILWPKELQLLRDLAMVEARIGNHSSAAKRLAEYLSAKPDDPQMDDLKALLENLRRI